MIEDRPALLALCDKLTVEQAGLKREARKWKYTAVCCATLAIGAWLLGIIRFALSG